MRQLLKEESKMVGKVGVVRVIVGKVKVVGVVVGVG
jgi:hypothetical protein